MKCHGRETVFLSLASLASSLAVAACLQCHQSVAATNEVPKVGNTADGKKVSLVVRINGFRNDTGVARVSLFSSPRGFPSDAAVAAMTNSVAISGGVAVTEFRGLVPAEYAVGVLHDENLNGRMDTNLVGVPREGYGVSRDVRGKGGPPAFESAKFKIESTNEIVKITVAY